MGGFAQVGPEGVHVLRGVRKQGGLEIEGWSVQPSCSSIVTLPSCREHPSALPPCSGWGYMLSRDMAEVVTNAALLYASVPEK